MVFPYNKRACCQTATCPYILFSRDSGLDPLEGVAHFVIGLLWKKVSRPAVWSSIIASPVITAILILVFGFDKGNWECSFSQAIKNGVSTSPLIGVICIIFSVIITVAVTLLTKAPEKELIYNAFDTPLEDEIK